MNSNDYGQTESHRSSLQLKPSTEFTSVWPSEWHKTMLIMHIELSHCVCVFVCVSFDRFVMIWLKFEISCFHFERESVVCDL